MEIRALKTAKPKGAKSEMANPRDFGDRCATCGKDADLLCDYIIAIQGFENYDFGKKRLVATVIGDQVSEIYTCDLPLCGECTVKSTTFICGEKKLHQFLDFCPHHGGEFDTIAEIIENPAQVEAMRARQFMKLSHKWGGKDRRTGNDQRKNQKG